MSLSLSLSLSLGGSQGGGGYVTLPTYATIATFGDSITVGTSASDLTHPGTFWASLLATQVGATLSNQGVSGTVLQNSNDSGGSARANNGRDRFISALTGASLKAAAFIAYGFNDARYTAAPATLNVANYKNDYREIINGLLSTGYARSDIYIGSPYGISDTGLNTGSTGFTGQTRVGFETFVTAAYEVAEEFGVRYCDLYAATNNATFYTNTDANDSIHPTDTGHATIFAAWRDRTLLVNSRAAPATVSASVLAQAVTVTAAAVSGAASYEYALISAYADALTNTNGAFTSVAAGTYRAKSRAVFSGGTKGPWTFATSDSTVAAASGIFVSDTFTDTNGVALTSHNAPTGGAWTLQSGNTTSAAPAIQSNQLYCAGTTGVFQNAGVPAGADMYAQADFTKLSAETGASIGLALRMQTGANTLYWARFIEGTGWQIWKTSAGASAQRGSTVTSPTFNVSDVKTVRFEVQGAGLTPGVDDPVLRLIVDGSTIINTTDNAGTRIATAGFAGIRSATAVTTTTGVHMDNYEAGTL